MKYKPMIETIKSLKNGPVIMENGRKYKRIEKIFKTFWFRLIILTESVGWIGIYNCNKNYFIKLVNNIISQKD